MREHANRSLAPHKNSAPRCVSPATRVRCYTETNTNNNRRSEKAAPMREMNAQTAQHFAYCRAFAAVQLNIPADYSWAP